MKLYETIFDELYALTDEIETIEECPAYVHGLFCNTTYGGGLDIELIKGGCTVAYDAADLRDFFREHKISPYEFLRDLRKWA